MELKRALELRTEYNGAEGVIRVDVDGYVCLNEMLAFFPNKSLKEWQKNKTTQEFIEISSKDIMGGNPPIIAKRGKGGGTWAIPIVAFEFATYLSPEFKYRVFNEYINGTQKKQNWNIARILASYNYKIMGDAIALAHNEPKPYHYSNEALMINEIVFGDRSSGLRDTATEKQLDEISMLESYNAAYIDLGLDFQTRKARLAEIFQKKAIKG